MKKKTKLWIALAALIPGMLHYARLFDFGNYTEEVSLFFELCAMWLLFGRKDNKRTILSGLLSGILCGSKASSCPDQLAKALATDR